MPTGSHKYFEQMDPYGGRIPTDDPEFVAKVRAKLGPEYEHLVDKNTKSQAANIGRPDAKFNYLGYYTPRNIFPSEEEYVKGKKEQAQFFKDLVSNKKQLEDMVSPNKSVYGVGAGASPQTFAHEFRHSVIHDEENNRLLDLISSNSPTQYRRNLESYYEQIHNKPADKIPLSELEYYFHEALNRADLFNTDGKDDGSYISAPMPLREKTKQTLENSGILSALPDVAQQYIQRKAAMDRVAQPYLNFGRAPPLGVPFYKDYE
jgi:hypothetical protein